ncbi:MAG: hypothetical protein AMXMBFR84_31290 [Candidatus Hydrogenedentota bacterium]
MPTYTYACNKCGAEQNEFHGISAVPKVQCSACGSKSMKRRLGTGSGLIFKGSGFYETDYKTKRGENGSAKAEAKSESKSDSSSASNGASSAESKPAAKAESAPKKGESVSKA